MAENCEIRDIIRNAQRVIDNFNPDFSVCYPAIEKAEFCGDQYRGLNGHMHPLTPALNRIMRSVTIDAGFLYERKNEEGQVCLDVAPALNEALSKDYHGQLDHDIYHIITNLVTLINQVYAAEEGSLRKAFERAVDEGITKRIALFPAKFLLDVVVSNEGMCAEAKDSDVIQIISDVASLCQARNYRHVGMMPIMHTKDDVKGKSIIIDSTISLVLGVGDGSLLSIIYNFGNNASKKFIMDAIKFGKDSMPYVPQLSFEAREISDAYYVAVGDSGKGISLDNMLAKAGQLIAQGRDLVGIDECMKEKLKKYIKNPLYIYKFTLGEINDLCFAQGLTGFGDDRINGGQNSSGFGLYGVKNICRLHNGRVYAADLFGESPYFVVMLPKDRKMPPSEDRAIEECPLPYHTLDKKMAV